MCSLYYKQIVEIINIGVRYTILNFLDHDEAKNSSEISADYPKEI